MSPCCWPIPPPSAAASRRRCPLKAPGTMGASGGGTDLTGSYLQRLIRGPGRYVQSQSDYLRRPELAGHRRRLACQAGMGRGPGLRRDPQRQRQRQWLRRRRRRRGLRRPCAAACDGEENKVGWGVDAGVKVNLQGWGGMFAARRRLRPDRRPTPERHVVLGYKRMRCGARTARSTATASRCWARTRSSIRPPTNGHRRQPGRSRGWSSTT